MYGNKSDIFTTEQILLDVKEQKTTPGHISVFALQPLPLIASIKFTHFQKKII